MANNNTGTSSVWNAPPKATSPDTLSLQVNAKCTLLNEDQYFATRMEDGWKGYDVQSRQNPHSRPSRLEPETIDAHFQRVLNRFKAIEDRRGFRSPSPGCWYNPTTSSPFAAAAAAATPRPNQRPRALWLLNHCQRIRELELKMIETHRIREELDALLQDGWSKTPTSTRQSVDWPAPPPPPRPYSPGPMPWMDSYSGDATPRAAEAQPEQKVEGIPVRISRTERRRQALSMPSSARVPAPGSMYTPLYTTPGRTLPPSHPWGATPSSLGVSQVDNAVPAGTLTGDILYSTPFPPLPPAVSQEHWRPASPPMLDDTTGQHRRVGRLRTTVDWRFGQPHESRGPDNGRSPSDGGRTVTERSPASERLHTPEDEVVPRTEYRVNYGFGTWVIRGPSDEHTRPCKALSALPASESTSCHHGTGTMHYKIGPGPSIPQSLWGYVQPEHDERIREARKEAAKRAVFVAIGLWPAEALERR